MEKRRFRLGPVARLDLLVAKPLPQVADRAEASHVHEFAAFARMAFHQIGGKLHAAAVKITLRDHSRAQPGWRQAFRARPQAPSPAPRASARSRRPGGHGSPLPTPSTQSDSRLARPD